MIATAARTLSWPGVILPAPQVYLVGGGIASMAAATFMIRDGDVFGQNITILEESDKIGGSLDGAGSPEKGYVLRGGRKRCVSHTLLSRSPAPQVRRSLFRR